MQHIPGLTACTQCGTRLPEHDTSATQPVTARPLRFAAIVLLLLAAVVLVTFATFIRYHRDFSSEALGYCIGSLLLPFLIAYAIAGAKRRRNGLTFSLCFFGLAILASIPSVVSRHKGLTDLPRAEMIKTMAGTLPLPADASDDDKRTVTATTQMFADMRQVNEDYNRKQAELAPEFPKLYTPEAFTSRSAIQHMLSVVQQKLALDQDATQKIQNFPEIVKTHLQNSKLSEAEKQDFIASFESQFGTSDVMKAHKDMVTAEEKWASATTDLYNFSLEHLSQISVTKTQIVITSGDVRTQFNNRYSNARQLRDEFNASARNFSQTRAALMNSQGIKPTDLGLKK